LADAARDHGHHHHVFVMVAVSSVLFLVADQIIRLVITFILGIAG